MKSFFFILLLFASESAIHAGSFALIKENGLHLAKRFRFTKEAAFRALHKLMDQELLSEIAEQGPKGRPRKLRKIGSVGWEKGKGERSPFQPRLLKQSLKLISNRLKKPRLVEQAGMNNTLFMLLLVLLTRADRSGVVATSSQADLSKYAGIPRSQVQRRINQLQELGVIAETIPGLVEGAILGKPSSVYFLDLNHPVLRDTGIRTEQISIRGKGCTSTEINQVAMKLGHPGRNDRLASAAQHAATPPGMKRTRISPGSWEQNAPAFLKRPAAKLYTQCVIERYAAKLLSNPISILSESVWRNAQDHATEDFVHELGGGRHTTVTKSHEQRRMFYSLCADLEELSHQLASLCLRMGKLPKRASTLNTPNTTYRILPSGTGKRSEIRLERITLQM
ncbi:helix-turn-helix domain-containing protein [Marinobacter sp. AC-23]|uniref:helix-turn-helix domain-containing protein n=1 Tax=Marinobacter sp. AC-23 TaxID=1879031 RepID=UPI0008DDC4B3|nr:helix-turn-helix domain-containing protein [Marinobacter sp. AC-23]OHY79476.1 hypothetical protein BCA33_16135 [Marinobacter sp. AC-23]